MEDQAIVALYFQRAEQAIAETIQKYGSLCRSIAQNLLPVRQDAEECVNDTWQAAWERIPPQQPRVLSAFLGRITRNLAISRFRKNTAKRRDAGIGVLLSAVTVFAIQGSLVLLAGLLAGSVAMIADAFNNLSDAGSSVVTTLGFQLAGQKPDSDHPFGHGRIEYLSGLAVSLLIFLMGFELAKSSFAKIRNPEPVEFSVLVAVILCASIAVKLYMIVWNGV